jgi:hypothetical protein
MALDENSSVGAAIEFNRRSSCESKREMKRFFEREALLKWRVSRYMSER